MSDNVAGFTLYRSREELERGFNSTWEVEGYLPDVYPVWVLYVEHSHEPRLVTLTPDEVSAMSAAFAPVSEGIEKSKLVFTVVDAENHLKLDRMNTPYVFAKEEYADSFCRGFNAGSDLLKTVPAILTYPAKHGGKE